MIGSFFTRGLVMVFGYAYPAYECYKTVEKNKPEIEQLRFWCQYWILVAVLTVCERIGDTFISWVPMYSEAKLAFFIYLWYPKTKGTTFVYDSFFRPYVAKHEIEIDRNLLELKARAGDIVVLYWQKAASYGQTRVFEILKFVASQSTPRPRPVQVPQAAVRVIQNPPAPNSKAPASTTEPEVQEPPSPTQSASSSKNPVGLQRAPTETPQAATTNSIAETKEGGASSVSEDTANSLPLVEEPSRVTRLRLRKTRSAATR